jgi:hypothetical protein
MNTIFSVILILTSWAVRPSEWVSESVGKWGGKDAPASLTYSLTHLLTHLWTSARAACSRQGTTLLTCDRNDVETYGDSWNSSLQLRAHPIIASARKESFAQFGRDAECHASLSPQRGEGLRVRGGQSRGSGKPERGIPSPLNGEKVAEGWMRGGNPRGSGSCLSFSRREPTLPLLTPALSPLRGEGEPLAASVVSVRRAVAQLGGQRRRDELCESPTVSARTVPSLQGTTPLTCRRNGVETYGDSWNSSLQLRTPFTHLTHSPI